MIVNVGKLAPSALIINNHTRIADMKKRLITALFVLLGLFAFGLASSSEAGPILGDYYYGNKIIGYETTSTYYCFDSFCPDDGVVVAAAHLGKLVQDLLIVPVTDPDGRKGNAAFA